MQMANHIVLYQPLIPANTGNISRTCAGTRTTLHLIRPLGFSTEDKALKRAGLDYWDHVDIIYHDHLDEVFHNYPHAHFYYITKFGQHTYTDCDYTIEGDHFFIFGQETKGLPDSLLQQHPERCLRIPMDDTHIRALNLSNTAALVLYEALRQQGWPQLT